MENTKQNKRPSLTVLLEGEYLTRQKENEIKLFENIKSDISIIISEQLKKRSKTEFELTAMEKKFNYLKNITTELETLIKQEKCELKNERDLIKNYFEYTTTNLDYIFIKYESIISDLSNRKDNMKLTLKEINTNDLLEFKQCYEKITEECNKLHIMKTNIIDIKNKICDLINEFEIFINNIEIKKKESVDIKKNYEILLTNIDEYKKEFDEIKNKCNFQMNEKKQSSINLNIIEEQIASLKKEIDTLCIDKKKVTDDLNNIKENNNNVLQKLFECNDELQKKCEQLAVNLSDSENELLHIQNKKKELKICLDELESKLNNINETCTSKKKEDEEILAIIKNLSNELITNRNILIEIEKEYFHFDQQFKILKSSNEKSINDYTEMETEINEINKLISKYTNNIEIKKKEITEVKEMKKENDKTKVELLNSIENSEKILVDRKNLFFKVSKLLNFISMSNDDYLQLKKEGNEEETNKMLLKCKELEEKFTKLSNELEMKEKKSDKLITDVDNCNNKIQKQQEEIKLMEQEQSNLDKKVQTILNDKEKCKKKIIQIEKNGEVKVKETTEMLKNKYQQLSDTLASHVKTKHVEHNNILKQGEKEKLELNYQLYKTEIVSNKEKEKEKKMQQLAEKEKELKIYQKKYSSLKTI
ncbi:conserved protein, unknown function [Hepatocystis sp. ex Piliocolobus tephrosceles]|nr:conserved protein, unknown function [Hepatocystis sp. ex Piliocolobus tephrosceles]